ncbi:glycosyltransferase family 2 protein [Paenibacillus massiliensis]|uniref:glycosyltransferase family 2 protein n=1 Tax=Paenibacillus massiliensis TaxID=225917 RepID=UPI0003721C72|nr:glycosyltransferase family 2 protein [Paenibacillus massiliensis]
MDLTIAICTRNREEDLARCAASIAASRMTEPSLQAEVLVVDDGDLCPKLRAEMNEGLERAGFSFRYYRKDQPGLWLSRVKTVEIAAGDIILFLDDDVELPVDYIDNLMRTYRENPDAAGVGGIALGMRNSLMGTLRCLLSFQQSPFMGRLSLSGQSGSMYNWHRARRTFKSEFFHGCNMSFRREAIRSIKPVSWLQSYSVGEDLLLSRIARMHGPLLINPVLKLQHHESPSSRDNMEHVAYMRVMNHVHLLRDERAGVVPYAALCWTTLYFILRERPKKNNSAIRGYAKALKSMFSREALG